MNKNTIIYLIGFAGVGKLTIAKEIIAKTELKLVDNHIINNPILSLHTVEGEKTLPPEIREKIERIRDIVLDSIIDLSPKDEGFVFTNELIEGKEKDIKIYKKVENVAISRKSNFFVIRLLCAKKELTKRVVSEDRKENFKLVDKEVTKEKIEESEVYDPKHPNTISLDVTNLSPEEVAAIILKKIDSHQ